MQVTLSDYQQELLLGIYHEVHKREGPELNELEMCEIALDILLNSYEAMNEAANIPAGKPLDAAAMKKALDEVTSPNLSTEYEQPGDVAPQDNAPPLMFKDILDAYPDNKYVKAAKGNELYERATVLVFNQFPEDQWEDKDIERHITKTIEILGTVGN